MRLDELPRNERHPLVQRDVGEVRAAEDLEETQRLVAGILDVMPHRERYVANIARLVIERARLAAAVVGIQAFKGVEFGLGFETARRPGSKVHDEIGYDASKRDTPGLGFVPSPPGHYRRQ